MPLRFRFHYIPHSALRSPSVNSNPRADQTHTNNAKRLAPSQRGRRRRPPTCGRGGLGATIPEPKCECDDRGRGGDGESRGGRREQSGKAAAAAVVDICTMRECSGCGCQLASLLGGGGGSGEVYRCATSMSNEQTARARVLKALLTGWRAATSSRVQRRPSGAAALGRGRTLALCAPGQRRIQRLCRRRCRWLAVPKSKCKRRCGLGRHVQLQPRDGRGPTMGLHSSTSQLNLSRLCHSTHSLTA